MSTMLEQAIVDAKTLREAAVKSAEAAIVEKYNDEVKDAISKLLAKMIVTGKHRLIPLIDDITSK